MNQQMQVDLYGASISNIEGATYAALYVGQAVVDEKEENAKGIVVMKIPCDPVVYESLKLSSYPAKVELEVRLKKAAGGRLGQHCVSCKPRSMSSPASTQPAKQ